MKEPFGLCPTNPKALELIQELHDELIDQFNSSKINIGMDETVDLGKGKSKQECQRIGKGEVFLKYVLNLHDNHQQKQKEREMTNGMQTQCWADILHHYPSLIEKIPKHMNNNPMHDFDTDTTTTTTASSSSPSFVALEWVRSKLKYENVVNCITIIDCKLSLE